MRSRLIKYGKVILTGAGVCGGAALVHYSFCDEGKLKFVNTVSSTNPPAKWNWNWDKRDPYCTSSEGNDVHQVKRRRKKSKGDGDNATLPTAVRNIILIRHGQYNMSGKTDKERVLTELGQKQAKVVGERLKNMNYPYTALIASTMTRAQETASFIHPSLPALEIKNCSLLEEGHPIDPDPPSRRDHPEYQLFQDGARIEAAFRKYFHRAPLSQKNDSYDILVCHGNVIRYFVCRALQLPPEAWLRLSIFHCSVTWVTIFPSGHVILRTYGDSGHIPRDMLTS